MLLIKCPHCGERPEIEFRCGGEAHLARPLDPAALDDGEWSEFLFYRKNIKGVLTERWNHAYGCQRWFNAIRNSVTDEILATYAKDFYAGRPAMTLNTFGLGKAVYLGTQSHNCLNISFAFLCLPIKLIADVCFRRINSNQPYPFPIRQ